MDLPDPLTSHQAAALVAIVTHIIHNPKAIDEVLAGPQDVLKNAGLSDHDLEVVENYVKALRLQLWSKIADDGSVW